jgi:hypothetical protein
MTGGGSTDGGSGFAHGAAGCANCGRGLSGLDRLFGRRVCAACRTDQQAALEQRRARYLGALTAVDLRRPLSATEAAIIEEATPESLGLAWHRKVTEAAVKFLHEQAIADGDASTEGQRRIETMTRLMRADVVAELPVDRDSGTVASWPGLARSTSTPAEEAAPTGSATRGGRWPVRRLVVPMAATALALVLIRVAIPAPVTPAAPGMSNSTAAAGPTAESAGATSPARIAGAAPSQKLMPSALPSPPNASLAALPPSPPTTASGHATRPLPRLTVTPSAEVISFGDPLPLTVRVEGNGADRRVVLLYQPGSNPASAGAGVASWTPLATLTTDGNGNATYVDRPSDSRYYRVKFSGAADLAPGDSAPVRVLVRQVNVLLPTTNGATATIARGTSILFTSAVQPARSDVAATVTFAVYMRTNGSWTLLASSDRQLDPAGRAAFTYKFASAGQFYVRAIAEPTKANTNSVWSEIERYDVR